MGILKFLVNIIPVKKWRKHFREYVFNPGKFKVSKDTKCLICAPHPDDEILGCGGILIKYAQICDCMCFASSGVATKTLTAEERADIRIQEFNMVMDKLGVKNHWIFKTFGIPPMTDQIKKHFDNYCASLDTIKYDYIFLPHSADGHLEHQYLTNNIFKKILKKNGYKKDCRIVFYEVWQPLSQFNHVENITNEIEKKKEILGLYKSQWTKYNLIPRIIGLNAYRGVFAENADYGEAFNIEKISKYMNWWM